MTEIITFLPENAIFLSPQCKTIGLNQVTNYSTP